MRPIESLFLVLCWLHGTVILAAEPPPTIRPGTLRVAIYEQFPPYSQLGQAETKPERTVLAEKPQSYDRGERPPCLSPGRNQGASPLVDPPTQCSEEFFSDSGNDGATKNNDGRGVDVELAHALARRLGLQLELAWFQAGEDLADDLRNMVWKGHYLGTRVADLMLHVPLDPALQRANEKVRIFGPYFRESMALASDPARLPKLNASSILAPETWQDAAIGVALDGWADTHLLRTLGRQSPHAIKHYRDNADALNALRQGKVSAVLAPRGEIEGLLGPDSRFRIESYRIPPPAPTSWTLGMAVASERAALARAIEAALEALRADGSLDAIFARHGLSQGREVAPAHAWVPNEKSGTISRIDLVKSIVLEEFAVGGRPRGIAIDRRGERLFVSDAEAHRLRVLDPRSGRLLNDTATGKSPEGVQLSPDGRLVAVAVEESNSVRLFDANTLAPAGDVAVRGKNPEHLAFSPDGRWLAVSAEEAEQVDVIDLEARQTVGQIAVGRRPRGLAFTPDGKRLFVACELADKLYVIDFPQRRVLAALDAGPFSNGVALSPDASRVFVSNGKGATVSVFDARSLERLAEIPVGQRPWNMAVTRDGKRLLVANGRSNSISVIDVSTLRPVEEIAVGAFPWGVAIQ